MTKLHQYAIMCADHQPVCGSKALRNGDDDVAMMREATTREDGIWYMPSKRWDWSAFEPYGAFYIFPCIKEFGMTSEELASRFLMEEKVAVVPGTAFGDCGEGFLRYFLCILPGESERGTGKNAEIY